MHLPPSHNTTQVLLRQYRLSEALELLQQLLAHCVIERIGTADEGADDGGKLAQVVRLLMGRLCSAASQLLAVVGLAAAGLSSGISSKADNSHSMLFATPLHWTTELAALIQGQPAVEGSSASSPLKWDCGHLMNLDAAVLLAGMELTADSLAARSVGYALASVSLCPDAATQLQCLGPHLADTMLALAGSVAGSGDLSSGSDGLRPRGWRHAAVLAVGLGTACESLGLPEKLSHSFRQLAIDVLWRHMEAQQAAPLPVLAQQAAAVVAISQQLWPEEHQHALHQKLKERVVACLWSAACLRLQSAPPAAAATCCPDTPDLQAQLSQMIVRAVTAAGEGSGSAQQLLKQDEVRYLVQLLLWSRLRSEEAGTVLEQVSVIRML